MKVSKWHHSWTQLVGIKKKNRTCIEIETNTSAESLILNWLTYHQKMGRAWKQSGTWVLLQGQAIMNNSLFNMAKDNYPHQIIQQCVLFYTFQNLLITNTPHPQLRDPQESVLCICD